MKYGSRITWKKSESKYVHPKTRNKLEQAGTSWNYLELGGIVWNELELPGTRWNHLEQDELSNKMTQKTRNS